MNGEAISGVALGAYGVSAALGKRAVLHDVTLPLAAGRWTSVVGPNGAGKSTLLRVLAGLLPCTAGEVQLQGRSLSCWTRRDRAQALSWLGQSETAADDLTVWDVAMLGRLPHQPWLAAPSVADHAAVEQALRATQAWDWRDRSVGQLSGGERQRVLLARALAVQAQVVLMDEPLANLDPPHQADWLLLVRQLLAEGKTVVSVLHELSMALLADDVAVLQAGRLVHRGAAGEGATHQALQAVFDQRIAVVRVGSSWVALPRCTVDAPGKVDAA